MNQTKRTINVAILMLFLFFVGCLLDVLPFFEVFLIRDLPSVYYLTVSLVAVLYFYRAVLDEKIRRYMVAIGSMVALWLFFRIEKYVAFKENVVAVRYLWYAYYIPVLMIPQLSFSVSLMVNRVNNKKPIIPYIFGTISSILLSVVLTNDMHQMVFKFNNGFDNVDDYSHQIVYYVIFVWAFVLMISSMVILLHKCSISANKKLVIVPIVYISFFMIWLVLIFLNIQPVVFGRVPGEFPEVISFLTDGMLILFTCIGLIPSNIGYGKLVSTIGFSAQITDADYKVVYRSPSVIDMTEEQMSRNELMLDANTKTVRKNVSGGYAYWQVDISELNQINDELEDVKETLSEEEEIIRLDNELKEKQAKIDEKSKVYDDIAVRVYNQSMMIERLSKQAKENPELFEQNMAMVCVLATYIKRLANLILLASDNESIKKIELLLSINESVKYLRKMGIIADVVANFEDNEIASNEAVYLYEAFEHIIEKANKDLKAIDVVVCDDRLKLTVEGAIVDLPNDLNGTVEIDGNTSFVSLFVRKEGAV